MIASHKLRKRDIYLNKLIAFQDTEPIKVVTGIRRCGKSSLLKLMAAHLRENGVNDEQIIEMNFESYEFIKMTSDRKSTRLNSSHKVQSRMPSSA